MSIDERRISIDDLPDNVSAELKPDDVQETAKVKGGVRFSGLREGFGAGKRLGIRALRDVRGIRKLDSGDSWLQR